MSTRSLHKLKLASLATVVLVLTIALLSTGWHGSTDDIALVKENTPMVSLLSAPARHTGFEQLASATALAEDEFGVTRLEALGPLDLLDFPEAEPELLAMAMPRETPGAGLGQPLWGGPFSRGIASGAGVSRSGGGGGVSSGGGAGGGGSFGGGSSASAQPKDEKAPRSERSGGRNGGGTSEFTLESADVLALSLTMGEPVTLVETLPTAVPEPSTLSLAGLGIALAALVRRRQA